MIRTTIEDLIDLLNTRGGIAYFGEPVSILEHSVFLTRPIIFPLSGLRSAFAATTSR